MRPQSFYLLAAIFMFFYMTFAPVIEAYNASIKLDLNPDDSCRIWIEDSNHNRIAGDGKGDYHSCTGSIGSEYGVIDFPDQVYYVVAKVKLTARKQKIRGPFNDNTCFRIHGNSFKFYFDQTSC